MLVRMYFWSGGDELQRKLNGFYRTVLFHTLCQCPELFKDIFPEEAKVVEPPRHIDPEFLDVELEKAFDRLVGLKEKHEYRFCYFIDGLDEYEEDRSNGYQNLARKLVLWANSENVKIVCSARPYTIFCDIFAISGARIDLHELTRSDIANFASAKFWAEIDIAKRTMARTACLGLVETIVNRADGVFLWASLVVASLIKGALGGEGKKALKKGSRAVRMVSTPCSEDA